MFINIGIHLFISTSFLRRFSRPVLFARCPSQSLKYPLVNWRNYGKSLSLMGKSAISMTIFNSYSYLSLPEGNYCDWTASYFKDHMPGRPPHDGEMWKISRRGCTYNQNKYMWHIYYNLLKLISIIYIYIIYIHIVYKYNILLLHCLDYLHYTCNMYLYMSRFRVTQSCYGSPSKLLAVACPCSETTSSSISKRQGDIFE